MEQKEIRLQALCEHAEILAAISTLEIYCPSLLVRDDFKTQKRESINGIREASKYLYTIWKEEGDS